MNAFENQDRFVTSVANEEPQAIRTLTDEEFAAVAGGMGPDLWE
jgi:hypothetical protein